MDSLRCNASFPVTRSTWCA